MRNTSDRIGGATLAGEPDPSVRFVGRDSPDFAALTDELDSELLVRYPALGDSDEFSAPDDLLACVIAYVGDVPIGCGALREFEPGVGEIKRMFVVRRARGLGVARLILEALEVHARELGYSALWLGTGIRQPEAIGLYESSGYRRIGQFGEYASTDQCVCYGKYL